jgi:filamentous hemagglutinin family protein
MGYFNQWVKWCQKAFIKEMPAVFVLLASAFFSMVVLANPDGGVVAAGNVSISTSGSAMQINQASQKAIVNWQTFNISNGEQVNIQQPNSSAIILNRVNPHQGISSIYGSLNANGHVWIVNPAGVYVGSGAVINVGGLLATTANISDENFINGHYYFVQSPEWNGSIINEGYITISTAGLAALVGPSVVNNGRIVANMGTIVLGSSKGFTVDFTGDQLINFHVGSENISSNTMQAEVTNSGALIANGGKIVMSTRTASGILDSVINMSGVAIAKSVGVKNGVIILDAGSGRVKVTGKLIASGKNANETGGTVKILGKQIALLDYAKVSVAGDAGGGLVLIGGNAHGAGPEYNAQHVFIGRNAMINASALTSGDGGNVVVWSDTGTRFYGSILVRGGSVTGNGGFVEVSSKYNLNFDGYVDASATNGVNGTLLLDPQFLIVSNSGGLAYDEGVNNLFANNPDGTNIITATSLNDLSPNTNVLLEANSDIIFNSDIDFSKQNTLTAYAGRSILINSNITTRNSAITLFANCDNVTCQASVLPDYRLTTSTMNPAGDTETVAGNIIQAAGTKIDSGSGTTTLTIGSSTTSPFTPGSITLYDVEAGNIVIHSPNEVTLNGDLSSTGTVEIQANTDGNGTNGFTLASGASITSTNTSSSAIAVTVNSAVSGTGGIVLGGDVTGRAGGTITLSTTGVTTSSGGNTTGGSITQLANSIINNSSGGVNINLFVPTAGNSGISGVSGENGDALATAAGNNRTITVTAGTGGASIYNTGGMRFALAGLATNAPISVIATGTLTLAATAISTGTGSLTLKSLGGNLSTSAPLSTTSGLMTLVSGGSLTINNPLSSTTGAIQLLALLDTITLNSTIVNTNTVGNAIVLASQIFINNAGALAIDPGIGHYQIWSASPFNNTLGGLVYDFKQYNATFGSSIVLGTGNGLFYTLAPIIVPSLTGIVSKMYDMNSVATLSSQNYVFSGVIDGDTVTLNDPVYGRYASVNVATGITVSVTGLAIASATNGSAMVYGYQLIPTSLSAKIGTITRASIQGFYRLLNLPKEILATTASGQTSKTAAIVKNMIQNNVGTNGANMTVFLQALTKTSVSKSKTVSSNVFGISPQTKIGNAGLIGTPVFLASKVIPLTGKNKQSDWIYVSTPVIALLVFGALNLAAYLDKMAALRRREHNINISSISFELRSALDTIIGFASLIYSGSVGNISSLQKEFLYKVLKQSKILKSDFQAFSMEVDRLDDNDTDAIRQFDFKLRLSLNSIIGFTSLVGHSNAGHVSMQQKRFLENILSASNELLYLLPNGR